MNENVDGTRTHNNGKGKTSTLFIRLFSIYLKEFCRLILPLRLEFWFKRTRFGQTRTGYGGVARRTKLFCASVSSPTIGNHTQSRRPHQTRSGEVEVGHELSDLGTNDTEDVGPSGRVGEGC